MIKPARPRVNKFPRPVALLLLACLILAACSGKPAQVLPVRPTTTQLAQLAVTTVVAPTQSVILPLTATDTPTLGLTKHVTATGTPTLPPTQTPRPTLSDDQAWDELFARLQPQNSCRFPCWWDLQPGKTTLEEVLQFHRHLGFETSTQDPAFQLYKNFALRLPKGPPGNKFSLQITTTMYEKALGMMEIYAGFAASETSDMFYQYMEPYSIEHVIAEYGKPDRVLVHPPSYYGENHVRGDGGNYAFDISLFYDGVGALISYRGEPSTFLSGGQQALVCPQLKDKQVENIFINLRASDDPTPLERLASRYGPWEGIDEEFLYPLEEVSDLTLDDFVATVTKSERACFGVSTR